MGGPAPIAHVPAFLLAQAGYVAITVTEPLAGALLLVGLVGGDDPACRVGRRFPSSTIRGAVG